LEICICDLKSYRLPSVLVFMPCRLATFTDVLKYRIAFTFRNKQLFGTLDDRDKDTTVLQTFVTLPVETI